MQPVHAPRLGTAVSLHNSGSLRCARGALDLIWNPTRYPESARTPSGAICVLCDAQTAGSEFLFGRAAFTLHPSPCVSLPVTRITCLAHSPLGVIYSGRDFGKRSNAGLLVAARALHHVARLRLQPLCLLSGSSGLFFTSLEFRADSCGSWVCFDYKSGNVAQFGPILFLYRALI